MTLKKILKLLGINVGLAAINIILYSRLFLHIPSRGSVLLMILAGGVTLFTIGAFFYLNMKVLSQSETVRMVVNEEDQDSLPALANSLNFYIRNNIHTFRDDLVALEDQVEKFEKKKKLYEESLLRKFTRTEITFAKFYGTFENVEDVFKQILKGVLSRLNSFDEEEYENMLTDKNVSRKNYLERKGIYDDYRAYVTRAKETGDDILIKIDRLQLEVSKLSADDPKAAENLESVKEIDKLISEVKWYK
ncbi:MAG: hypothetical protein LBF40_08770 [Deltaproteobacteria bacterium]|jgi:hypothetical protein|nr:hypothetical protein [Deltaproteobacteria bacterium]